MPPAFVLSQDQTLKTIVSKHLRVQILVMSFVAHSLTHLRVVFLSVFSLRNFQKYDTSLRITGTIVFVLFNFQGPCREFQKLFLSFFRQRLYYLTTLSSVCQEFF